jgi:anti-anti-sigma factor
MHEDNSIDPDLSVIHHPTATVVRFRTASLMNVMDVDRIAAAIDRVVDARGATGRLVLEFGPVKYVSSRAIGMVVGLRKRLAHGGGKLVLCGVGPTLRELIRLTGLDRVLTIKPTLDEALAL